MTPVASLRMTDLQALKAVGFTQASSVIAFVRSSAFASLTVTQLSTPLNDSEPPDQPVVHDAPVIVPVLPPPEMSATLAPDPSLNPYAATSPPSGAMVTVTPAPGVSRFPLSSVARLRRVAEPFADPGPAGVHVYVHDERPVARFHVLTQTVE